jgi:hypothetical protein
MIHALGAHPLLGGRRVDAAVDANVHRVDSAGPVLARNGVGQSLQRITT